MLATGSVAWAETTPMDAKLVKDSVTLIECTVRIPRENRGVFSKRAVGFIDKECIFSLLFRCSLLGAQT